MAISVGEGTTLTFASFTMGLTSVSWSGASRGFTDTSTLSTTTWRTKIPHALTDPGGLDIEGFMDGTQSAPLTGSVGACAIQFADGTGYSFSGFMTSFDVTSQLDGVNTFSGRIEATGEVTFDTSGS